MTTVEPVFTETELEHEEWRPIVAFEGIYAVSSLGRIKSLIRPQRRTDYIMSPKQHPNTGYLQVPLRRPGSLIRASVHREVAKAFLVPSRWDQIVVNHIDGVKTNNRVSNLEWVSHKENHQHAARLGLAVHGCRSHFTKLTEEQVRAIRNLHKTGTCNYVNLATRFEVHPATIRLIVQRINWKQLD